MADQDRYSKKQLADWFGRSERTIERWVQLGRIPKPRKKVSEPFWTKEQFEKATQMIEVSK